MLEEDYMKSSHEDCKSLYIYDESKRIEKNNQWIIYFENNGISKLNL